MAAVQPVRLVGLKEFQRDLRAIDAKLPRELRVINLQAANLVVSQARSTAAGLGAMQARAAQALTAQAEQRNASVRLRATAAAPFALGAEFGAGRDVPRHRSTGTFRGYNQFQPWRGNGEDAGYFVYPAIRASNAEIVQLYADRIGQLLSTAFPN